MERSVLARRVAPFAVFAAVVGAIVAVNARGGGSGAPAGDRPLAALPLSAGFRAGGAGTGEAAPRDSSASGLYYGGEIVIPDRLLAGQPVEGPVLDVGATAPATALIERLARALGVSGEVRADADGWVAGTGERVLRVLRHTGNSWYLGPDKMAMGRAEGAVSVAAAPATASAEPAPAPTPSGGDTPVSSDPTCKPVPDGGSGCADPGPVDCPPPPDGTEPACAPPRPLPEPTKPPQPTDDEARAAARPALDVLGLADAPSTLNDAWSGKEVVASPVVAGLPTSGFDTRITVAKGGDILWASGFLGATAKKGDYPLLAPREAVERGGAYGPGIARDSIGAPCPPEEPCPTPAPREATRLRLGLVFMTSFGAEQEGFLAPAWLLTFEGSAWEEPVLALPDRYIETPPPATDQPAVTDPGGEPGSVDGGGGSAPNTGAPEQK